MMNIFYTTYIDVINNKYMILLKIIDILFKNYSGDSNDCQTFTNFKFTLTVSTDFYD